jgi:hypothetical protein
LRMVMNKRIKKLWIKALRSGKYEQDTGWLRTAEGYCCLGVLCELYRKQVGGKWENNSFITPDGFEDAASLPRPVRDWAELESCDPKLSNHPHARAASVLNDTRETFAYIAERIEKYL